MGQATTTPRYILVADAELARNRYMEQLILNDLQHSTSHVPALLHWQQLPVTMCTATKYCILQTKVKEESKILQYDARFTLADPMPRLASDRDETIRRRVGTSFTLAEWHAMRTFASVGTREPYNIVRLPGWYGEGVLFITTLSCVVHVRLPIGWRRRAILHV